MRLTTRILSAKLFSFCIAALALASAARATDNWPGYRGPTDQGHADSPNLPLHWSETENVAWKIALPGKSRSTPAIWGDRVWATTATEDGKELSVLCIDKNTGEFLINRVLHKVEKPSGCVEMNSYATPSPVVEEGRVYVSYGPAYLACLDTATGEVVWDRDDIACRFSVGAASCPMIYKDLLITHYDGCDKQFVLAVDKRTGKDVWKTDRTVEYDDIDPETNRPKQEGEFRKAFSAPIVTEIGGRPVLASLGSMALYAYDPDNGKELWRLDKIGSYSGVMRPVAEQGVIYCEIGSNLELLAVKPEKADGVLDPEKCTLWKYKKTVPFMPSILLVDGRIFMTTDGGVAVCLDAKTGKQLWKERLEGDHCASPIDNCGRIYFFGQNGKATIIEAGPKFKVLAENKLDEGMMASPAVSGDALYLRTINNHLYCIKNK
jgi:outer membrane protein assembly factor BamB